MSFRMSFTAPRLWQARPLDCRSSPRHRSPTTAGRMVYSVIHAQPRTYRVRRGGLHPVTRPNVRDLPGQSPNWPGFLSSCAAAVAALASFRQRDRRVDGRNLFARFIHHCFLCEREAAEKRMLTTANRHGSACRAGRCWARRQSPHRIRMARTNRPRTETDGTGRRIFTARSARMCKHSAQQLGCNSPSNRRSRFLEKKLSDPTPRRRRRAHEPAEQQPPSH